MPQLITNHPVALQYLMTEDLYCFKEEPILLDQEIAPIIIEYKDQINKPLTIGEPINKEPEVYNYLGENNKYFLLLVDDATHKTLNQTHLETLLKITKAKGLELRDLAILNLHTHAGASFDGLKSYFVCSKVVLFGISPQKIGIPEVTLNKAEKFKDVSILATYSLPDMDDNKQKKIEFWNVMKSF